jgi:hypothetical protein
VMVEAEGSVRDHFTYVSTKHQKGIRQNKIRKN